MFRSLKIISFLLAGALALGALPQARAQDKFPSKPIRIVIPFAAGSAAAILAREVAKEMEPRIGQSVIVEARPGGNSIVGAAYVAKSPPDGYTLMFGASSATSAARALFKSVPYDPINDFAAVILYQEVYFTLLTSPEEKGTTLAQFLEKMKRNPARNSIGGAGSTTEILSKMVDTGAKTGHTYVRYNNSGIMITDVIGGRLGAAFHNVSLSVPMLKSGQAHVIAVSSPVPLNSLPNVPTIASTLPDVILGTFNGYVAPAKTPRPIVHLLHRHFTDVFKLPAFVAKSEESGRPLNMSPEEADAYVRSEEPRWTRLARLAGIEPE